MKILKFGGSSVASPETISHIRAIITDRIAKERLVIVFSAFQGVTNQLLNCALLASKRNVNYKKDCQTLRDRHLNAVMEMVDQKYQAEAQENVKKMLSELEELCYGVYLLGELSNRIKDEIVSFGERLSTFIISNNFKSHGIDNVLLDTRQLIITDESYTNALVDHQKSYYNIKRELSSEKRLAIVPGFIGGTKEGITTTLGRGGSDYTAAIFAHALDAELMEKWTDVSGMMSSDPRVVKSSQVINTLSYLEAMELCHFGAKVIYPPTIHPLLEKNIPILIKNTFDPSASGTLIFNQEKQANGAVKGLSSIGDISLLTLSGSGMVGVPGFSKRMFSALSRESINIILITQASSEHSITVVINSEDSKSAVKSLNEEFAYDMSLNKIENIVVEDQMAIIALVGDNMQYQSGISGKSLYTLGKNGINIRAIAQGSSERNISIVLEENDVSKALNSLHESFFEAGIKRLNLFLLGVGNVGGTLINQLTQQQDELFNNHQIDVKVVGLGSSKKMHFNPNGIELSEWRDLLDNSETMDLNSFVGRIKDLNLRNSVFVDNTASKLVGEKYLEILKGSISVVASNKTAASSSYEEYQKIKDYELKFNTSFMNETNVGAGLPIIDTIQNLIKSGDEIQEIRAVLSGSLNFIFNNFTSDTNFVDVVKQAMKDGYTEPDPRIDLSGVDVQRKILILARESGLEMEMDDIENEPFLPEELLNNGSVEDFLKGLEAFGSTIEARRKQAESEGKKLKYVASLSGRKAKVSLQEVAQDHAFYSIEGKDNIVMLNTKRYEDQPMVIKGAGAGAEVTAMGVFADIIRLAND